ncbi:class I tRNA ligase family protein [Nocardia xishanensis]|uniref:class I tRNA ligase family protein n=1 Tax=Nocardia xishanensis TaxID=238964 RepID=UPI0033CE300F
MLKLLHPMVPFVTEKLWTTLTGGESLIIATWPSTTGYRDAGAESEIAALQHFVTEVRRFRLDQGLPTTKSVLAQLELTVDLQRHEPAIRQLLRLEPAAETFTATATLPLGAS